MENNERPGPLRNGTEDEGYAFSRAERGVGTPGP